LLESMQIEEPDKYFPLDDKGQPVLQPPPDPKIQLEATKLEIDAKDKQSEHAKRMAEVERLYAEVVKIMTETGSIERSDAAKEYDAITKRINTERQALKDMGDLKNQEAKSESQRSNGGGVAS